jgi:glycosyltransferase involved in cell wall biosynthesis
MPTKNVESPVELSILMPCLNEIETLATCIDKARSFLRDSGIAGEIIIADNGSTDGSIEVAEAHGARVVHVPVRGYGAALGAGIAAARGRFVIMGDSDDSYDFSRLQAYVDGLRAGADLVMGNRFRGGIKPGAMPFLHRYLGNPVLSFIGRLFFKIPVGDFHCGLRGFRRERMLELGLSTTGMEFASEMIVRSALAGLDIREVPTTLSPDGRSRPPHLRTWRDGWRHLRFLLLFSPRWLFLYPGILIMGFGLILVFALLPGPMQLRPGLVLDIHSIIVGCLALIIGAQCLSFAIIARHYAAVRGFLPVSDRVARLWIPTQLEPSLAVAAVLGIGGVAGFAHSLSQWWDVGFGPLEYGSLLRVLTVSCTAIALALQLAFTAFLSSILDLGVEASARTENPPGEPTR